MLLFNLSIFITEPGRSLPCSYTCVSRLEIRSDLRVIPSALIVISGVSFRLTSVLRTNPNSVNAFIDNIMSPSQRGQTTPEIATVLDICDYRFQVLLKWYNWF